MSDIDLIIDVAVNNVKTVSDLSSSLRYLSTSMRALNLPASKLDTHTRALNKALGITSRGMNDHAKSVKQLAGNQKVLGSELRRITNDIRAYQIAMRTAAGSNKEFRQESAKNIAELQKMQRAFRGLKIRALGSDFQSVALNMRKMGKDAQFVGRSLMINLTAPIILFGRTALTNFVKVERELIRLTKVLDNVALSSDQAMRKLGPGADASSISKMTNAFIKLNNELTRISSKYGVAKEIVVGLSSDFAELGITSADNISKLAELTTQVEKLGAMDISGSYDLIQALYFQSVRAYENTGAFANLTKAIDRERMAVQAATTQLYMFNAIENVTALTLRDLATAFPEVSSVAVSFGLSMTEAAALLAPMKAAGLDVGASANSIKVSLQRLISPTKQNSEMLANLAKKFGESNDTASAFNNTTKTGLKGLLAIVDVFDKVKNSTAGAEGAMQLLSDVFEKRQGPRMYIAIEQMSLFNRELNQLTRRSNTAEGSLANIAEDTIRQFNALNNTSLPETINNFADIGIIARIATGHAGQMVEGYGRISRQEIATAKEVRKAVSDRILMEKQTAGRDLISEVRTESGRAMIVELAGASNAQQIAMAELDEALAGVGVSVEIIRNNFKLFAAEIIRSATPAIKALAEKLTELSESFRALPQETKDRIGKIVVGFLALLSAIGPLVLAFGTLKLSVGVLGGTFGKIFPDLSRLREGFTNLGNAAMVAANKAGLASDQFLFNYQKKIGKIATGQAFIPPDLIPTAPGQKLLGQQSLGPYTNVLRSIQLANIEKAPLPEGVTAEEQLEQFRRLRSQGAKKLPATRGARGRFVRADPMMQLAYDRFLRGDHEKSAIKQIRAQELFAARQPLFEKAGVVSAQSISDTGGVGRARYAYKGRDITSQRARDIAMGGMTGARARVAEFGARIAESKTVARTGNLGKGFIDALNPVKQYKSAVSGAEASVAALRAKHQLLGASAPGQFKIMLSAVKGFTGGIRLATLGIKVMKIALISSGIGAILVGVGLAVALVVKHFDTFKRAGSAGFAQIGGALKNLKKAALEIARPFIDLFAMFGKGSKGGAGAAEAFGLAFNKIGKAVNYVARLVVKFVNDVVKPYLYAIVNIVMAVVEMFKGNWGQAFKYLAAAVSRVIQVIISLWQMLAKAVISITFALVKGIVTLFFKGIVNGLIQAVLLAVRGVVNFLGKIPGLSKFTDPINNALKNVGSMASNMTSKAANGINGVIGNVEKFAKKSVDFVGNGIKKGLKKGADLGIQESTGALLKGKSKYQRVGKEIGQATGEAISNASGEGLGSGADKNAQKLKEKLIDAAQKLQDYVRDAFRGAIDKLIDNSVKALTKQKDAALKVFDVQLKTLAKLEKAEESLTKTKEFQINMRRILDERELNRQNYVRNRALAIYEGRVDDAAILDLEQKQSEKESAGEEDELNVSRRRDLARENLEAFREAIEETKNKAAELFDANIEKFKEAAAELSKIGPVTIEDFTKMRASIVDLANNTANDATFAFGQLFENYATTIQDKMPNKVVGAFSENLGDLVVEAREKYGLGGDQSENTVIGITLGMLTAIGDKMGEKGPEVVAAFGEITTDLKGNLAAAQTTMLEDVQTAFLDPFKAAFDASDPTAVYKKAITDGNAAILADFRNTVTLNEGLMNSMAAALDPAIKKYAKLQAQMEATADAAGSAADALRDAALAAESSPLSTGPGTRMSADTYEARKRVGLEVARYTTRRTRHIEEKTLSGVAAAKDALKGLGVVRENRFGEDVYYPGAVSAGGGQVTAGMSEKDRKSYAAGLRARVGISARRAIDVGLEFDEDKNRGYAIGGFVSAPKTQGVPTILHGGEFIINADAVDRIGIGALTKLNDDRLPKFKKGGPVPTKTGMRPLVADRLEESINRQKLATATSGKGMVNKVVGEKGLVDKSISGIGSFLKSAGKSLLDTAVRAYAAGPIAELTGTAIEVAKGNFGAIKNYGRNDVYDKKSIDVGNIIFGTNIPGLNKIKYNFTNTGKKAMLEDVLNVVPISAGGIIGKLGGSVASRLAASKLGMAMAQSGLPSLVGAHALLTKAGVVGGTAFAGNITKIKNLFNPKINFSGFGSTGPSRFAEPLMHYVDEPLSYVADEVTEMMVQVRRAAFASRRATPPTIPVDVPLPAPRRRSPEPGQGFYMPRLDQFIFHGGPADLFGGMVNPEFIRGGRLYEAAFRGLGDHGLTEVYSIVGGTEAIQTTPLLETYLEVANIIRNQMGHRSGSFAEIPKKLASVLFPDLKIPRNTESISLPFNTIVKAAERWVVAHKGMLEEKLAGHPHMTGVRVGMSQRNETKSGLSSFGGGGSYSHVGAVHLLKIPADKIIRNMGGSGDNPLGIVTPFSFLNRGAAFPSDEIQFFGRHVPIGSIAGTYSTRDTTQDPSKLFEANAWLMELMVRNVNASLGPQRLAQYLDSVRRLGNEITPGARSFLFDHLQRITHKFYYPLSDESINNLIGAVTTSRTPEEIIKVLTQLKMRHFEAGEASKLLDELIEGAKEIILRFGKSSGGLDPSASDFVLPRPELAVPAFDEKLDAIIHSGIDAALLNIPGAETGKFTYREALNLPQNREALIEFIWNKHKDKFLRPGSSLYHMKGTNAYKTFVDLMTQALNYEPMNKDLLVEKLPFHLNFSRLPKIQDLLPGLAALGIFGGASAMFSPRRAEAAPISDPFDPSQIVASMPANAKNKFMEMFNIIASGESLNAADPYSAWYGGKGMMMENMTAMTIDEVMRNAQGRAVGKYQFMPKYMALRAKQAGLSGSDLFSPANQEKLMMSMFMSNMQVAGIDGMKWLSNKMSTAEFVNIIANTWRGVPMMGGQYVGGGNNVTGIDPQRRDLKIFQLLEQIKSIYGLNSARLPGYKMGGYISGIPTMGVPAILHGGEYVVNSNAVRNIGLDTMNQINRSRFFAPSGAVNSVQAPVTQNVSTVNINVDTFIGEEEWFKSMMSSYNVNILPRQQKLAGGEVRTFTTYNGINKGY